MRQHHSIFFSILLLVLISCSGQADKEPLPITETSNLFKRLKSDTISDIEKRELLEELTDVVSGMPNDSLKIANLIKIYKHYLKFNDTIQFKQLNLRVRNLSRQISDSTHLARSNEDLAHFYYNKTTHIDSAYFYFNESYKISTSLGDYPNAARVLINISTIQLHIKDYLGCEASAYKAIELLEAYKRDNFHLYRAYNNIGVALKG